MTTESIPTRLLVWHEQTDPTKLLRITDAIRRGDPLPPIEAMAIGHKFLVLDGAHRAQAHQYCHRSEIRARLHNLPLSAEVPGWSHSIPRDAAAKLAHLLLPVDALGQAEHRPARGAPSGGDRFTTTARHLSRLPPDRASCLRAWNQTSRPGVLQRSDDRRRHHDLAPAERGHVVGHRQQSRTPTRNCDPVRPDPPARRHRGFRDDTRHLRRVTTRANSAPPLDEGQPRGRCSCSGRDSIRDQ